MGIVRYLCITIFLVFLSVSVSADKVVANAPTAGCSDRGREGINGLCLCESGYGGANCEDALSCDGLEIMMPSSQTADLAANTQNSYPKLDELFNTMNFTANTLTASIFGPVVANRTYTDVKFVGATKNECALGTVGSFWALSADETSCADRLALTMPWVNHTVCGWTLQNNIAAANVPADVWQFKATILISYVDILPGIDQVEEADEDTRYVERRASSAFHMYVNFQKFVTVVIEEVLVYSEVNLTVAITKFDYNPANFRLTITLHTVLQWPNQIRADFDHQPFVSIPDDLQYVAGSLVIASANCPMDIEGTKCLQVIEFQVDLAANTDCDFNGNYNLNATVATCRDDGSGASQDYGVCQWKYFTADFWIEESNICGSVEAKPTIAGKLAGFTDALYSVSDDAFNLGERGYFEVVVDSENDLNLTFVDIWVSPEATATETDPKDIYFLQNYQVIDKWDFSDDSVSNAVKNPNYPLSSASIVDIKFTTANHGVVLYELADDVQVWSPRFNFHFDGWVFRPEVGQSRIYTLRAKAKITYTSNEYNDAGKREIKTRIVDYVWKESGANVRASADYSVSAKAAPSATVGSSSNNTNMLAAVLPVAGVALVAIVGAIVIAVIIVKRKKATAFRPFN